MLTYVMSIYKMCLNYVFNLFLTPDVRRVVISSKYKNIFTDVITQKNIIMYNLIGKVYNYNNTK